MNIFSCGFIAVYSWNWMLAWRTPFSAAVISGKQSSFIETFFRHGRNLTKACCLVWQPTTTHIQHSALQRGCNKATKIWMKLSVLFIYRYKTEFEQTECFWAMMSLIIFFSLFHYTVRIDTIQHQMIGWLREVEQLAEWELVSLFVLLLS
jgi:hypothetical protein